MDYSLLVGIHNLDLSSKEDIQARISQKQKLVAHSTAMESIQAQADPIDDQDHIP